MTAVNAPDSTVKRFLFPYMNVPKKPPQEVTTIISLFHDFLLQFTQWLRHQRFYFSPPSPPSHLPIGPRKFGLSLPVRKYKKFEILSLRGCHS